MATETHAAEAAGAAGHAAESVGMPQLDFSTFPNQIFWLVVTLVIIYWLLSNISLPRIASILSERLGTITADIAAAEELKARAVEAEEAYNKALAEARAKAGEIAAAARAEIQKDLDAAIERADAEIAAKAKESEAAVSEIRAGALASIEAVAKEAAQDIVAALGGKATAKAVGDAVAARLKG